MDFVPFVAFVVSTRQMLHELELVEHRNTREPGDLMITAVRRH